jgi:flagellar basal-body rod protein FlgC
MSVYGVIGSALTANKLWMETTANNLANINTTRTKEGGPYHRQTVVFEAKEGFNEMFDQNVGKGVQVARVVQDPHEKRMYMPDHPDANKEGIVYFPEIQMAAEMTNLTMASKSYQANVTTLQTVRKMNEKILEIGNS